MQPSLSPAYRDSQHIPRNSRLKKQVQDRHGVRGAISDKIVAASDRISPRHPINRHPGALPALRGNDVVIDRFQRRLKPLAAHRGGAVFDTSFPPLSGSEGLFPLGKIRWERGAGGEKQGKQEVSHGISAPIGITPARSIVAISGSSTPMVIMGNKVNNCSCVAPASTKTPGIMP